MGQAAHNGQNEGSGKLSLRNKFDDCRLFHAEKQKAPSAPLPPPGVRMLEPGNVLSFPVFTHPDILVEVAGYNSLDVDHAQDQRLRGVGRVAQCHLLVRPQLHDQVQNIRNSLLLMETPDNSLGVLDLGCQQPCVHRPLLDNKKPILPSKKALSKIHDHPSVYDFILHDNSDPKHLK